LLVTSGSVFWIVAVGPEKITIFGLEETCCSGNLLSYPCCSVGLSAAAHIVVGDLCPKALDPHMDLRLSPDGPGSEIGLLFLGKRVKVNSHTGKL
jgi:hypothetical protein